MNIAKYVRGLKQERREARQRIRHIDRQLTMVERFGHRLVRRDVKFRKR